MGLDGNEEQSKRAAEHMLEVWDAKRAREKPEGVSWKGSAPGWIALALSAGTVLFNVGILSQNVADNERRIARFESAGLESAIARLESKVDLLVEDRARNLDSRGSR